MSASSCPADLRRVLLNMNASPTVPIRQLGSPRRPANFDCPVAVPFVAAFSATIFTRHQSRELEATNCAPPFVVSQHHCSSSGAWRVSGCLLLLSLYMPLREKHPKQLIFHQLAQHRPYRSSVSCVITQCHANLAERRDLQS